MNLRTGLAVPALALGLSVASPAQEGEQRIKMENLPPAVKKTVLEVSKGVKLRGLAREVEKGKTYYEAELDVNGRTRDVTIDPAGAVVLVEEEVTLDSLPSAARTAIEKSAEGGEILLVESLARNNKVEAYEAHIRKAGRTLEVKVDPDGKPILEK